MLAGVLTACGFPVAGYRAAFPDLAGMSDEQAAEHFVHYGAREGRFVPMTLRLDGLAALCTELGRDGSNAGTVLQAMFTMQVRAWPSPLDEWTVDRAAILRATTACGGVPILVFGDSHAIIYAAQKTVRDGRWLLPVDLRCIGASARGLGRDGSASGNGGRIRRFLDEYPGEVERPRAMLFAFGQVDLEFVLPYSAIRKHGLGRLPTAFVENFIARTVDHYVAFLRLTVPEGQRGSTTVASVLPPTLSDEHWAEGYISQMIGVAEDADMSGRLRAFRIPRIAARAMMHRAFNARLAKAALAAGFSFLDAFSAFLGPDGCVEPSYTVISQGRDHHLDQSAVTFARADQLLWDAIGGREPIPAPRSP